MCIIYENERNHKQIKIKAMRTLIRNNGYMLVYLTIMTGIVILYVLFG